MKTITFNISDDIMQKLEEQNQPLQTLLLQALNDYFQKAPLINAQIENLTIVNEGKLYSEVEIHKATSDGQKMAEALNQIAATSPLTELDPMAWQKEIRGDRLNISPK